jgi:hypothetical protein
VQPIIHLDVAPGRCRASSRANFPGGCDSTRPSVVPTPLRSTYVLALQTRMALAQKSILSRTHEDLSWLRFLICVYWNLFITHPILYAPDPKKGRSEGQLGPKNLGHSGIRIRRRWCFAGRRGRWTGRRSRRWRRRRLCFSCCACPGRRGGWRWKGSGKSESRSQGRGVGRRLCEGRSWGQEKGRRLSRR